MLKYSSVNGFIENQNNKVINNDNNKLGFIYCRQQIKY